MLGLKNINKNILELPKGVSTTYTLATDGGKQNITELPDEVYNTYPILDTLGRVQKTTIVSEGGLYPLESEAVFPACMRNPRHRGGHF